jgi:16S rRNA C1402 (ribose-2'-O) methylase RsmI
VTTKAVAKARAQHFEHTSEYEVVVTKSGKRAGRHLWRSTDHKGSLITTGGSPCIGPYGAGLVAEAFEPGTRVQILTVETVIVTRRP